jgi:hypothetical protein
MFMGGMIMTQSRTLARLLAAVGAAVVALALLAPVASAEEPKEGYKQFAGCPSKKEVPTQEACFRTVVTGGHFQMGSKDVPIEKSFQISGGLTTTGQVNATAKGGLEVVKQKVPGGVIGLTGLTWLLEFLGSEALTLYAATELAGVPGNPLAEPIVLPIRVHLINGVLGNNCYVGSFTNPIVLNLTPGTTSPPPPNKPITGHEGEFSVDSKEIIHLKGNEFVDNSFAAPGASGCVLTLFGFIPISINGLVNAQSGLPAAAGTNETRQNNDSELVAVQFVY